jgi:hypothetical protein
MPDYPDYVRRTLLKARDIGQYYDRLIKLIDPEAPTHAEYLEYVRAHRQAIGKTPTWEPLIAPELGVIWQSAAAGNAPARQNLGGLVIP